MKRGRPTTKNKEAQSQRQARNKPIIERYFIFKEGYEYHNERFS